MYGLWEIAEVAYQFCTVSPVGRNLFDHFFLTLFIFTPGRPSNFQQTLEHSFEDLNHGLYTDVTLVPDDGESVIQGVFFHWASYKKLSPKSC